MQRMQIKVSECDVQCDWVCCLCGKGFKSGSVMADAFVDDGDYGVVCEECVRVGPKKIRERMIKRAESLRRRAANIESLASQAIIECATWADWKTLERKIRKTFQKGNF